MEDKTPKSKRKFEGRSLWMDGWIRLKRNKLAMFGLALVIIICLAAIFAPYITRYDPNEQFVWSEGIEAKLAPPSSKYWFGTDVYGRDIFTRVIYELVFTTNRFCSYSYVLIIGVILGYSRILCGFVDDFISWLTNVIFAFPFLLLC